MFIESPPAIDRLVREYVRVQSGERASGASRPPGEPVPHAAPSREIVEKYLADSRALQRDTEGRPVYDDEGRVRLRPPKEIAAEAAQAANALADHFDSVAESRSSAAALDPAAAARAKPLDPTATPKFIDPAATPKPNGHEPPLNPDAVQRRPTPDGERYTGRFLDEDALDALVDSGHLSPAELDQLDRLNTALRDSEGRGVALTRFELADPAQPRTQRDTGIPGHWRSEIVTGLEIARDGSIALQTLAPEALRRTAADLAASDDGWRWLRDPGAIVRDLYTDAQHRLTARPPDSTHTGNAAAKSALIERAFGPTHTSEKGAPSTTSGGVRTISLPLHDLNRALVVEGAIELGAQYSPRPRQRYGIERPLPEPGTIEYDSFEFGDYLELDLGIPRPRDMVHPHAHHILRKKGSTAVQQALIDEGQAILRRYGVDPIFGKEVLVWAPQYAKHQHSTKTLRAVVSELKKIEQAEGDRTEIVAKLAQLGKIAAKRK